MALSVLTTDEKFDDVGEEHLRDAKIFAAWRNQQRRLGGTTVDGGAVRTSMTEEATAIDREDGPPVDLSPLQTQEPFPNSSPDEADNIDSPSESPTAFQFGRPLTGPLTLGKTPPGNKRKQPIRYAMIFDDGNSNQPIRHWWSNEAKLREMIPENTNGIISVLDRRINMDEFASGEHPSLYAMLRAWVQDDPYQEASPPKRKSLDEYASMEPLSKLKKGQQQQQHRAPLSTPRTPEPSVDIAELLRQAEDRNGTYRPNLSYFQLWSVDKRYRARRNAIQSAYRIRLARARESLRNRGIDVGETNSEQLLK